MITELFLDGIFGIVQFLTTWLPNPETLPIEVGNAFNSLGDYLYLGNAILPVPTLMTILGLVIGLEASIQAFYAVNWLYDKVRGAG